MLKITDNPASWGNLVRIYYISLIILLFLPILLNAQFPNLKFEHLSVEDGLSSSIVTSILQDRKGFMWMATYDGLNKYDGYNFTIYRHDPANFFSLSDNEVQHIYEDPYGFLWISTSAGGLNRFDPVTEKFTHYLYDSQDSTSISSNSLRKTAGYSYDGKYILWIGTSYGLNKFDPETEKFTHYPLEGKQYPYRLIETLAVDSTGNVWVGTPSAGLYKFDPYIEKYTHYSPNQNNYNDPHLMSLMCDKEGILWIGSRSVGGLSKFDPRTENFTSYRHDPKNLHSISHNWVIWILEDQEGRIWAASPAGGLNMLDRKTGKFVRFLHNPGDPYNIADNTVMTLYEDRSGVLWAGTWKGISKTDPGKSRFYDIKQIPGDPNSLDDNYITSLCTSAQDNVLWIGTKMGGLHRMDRATGKITHYRYDPYDPNSVPSDNISALYEDHLGIFWIGTWGAGMAQYDPEKNQFIRINNDPDKLYDIIRFFAEDRNGGLWIATRFGGLVRFDRKSNTFYTPNRRKGIEFVMEDRTGILWYGGFTGLEKLNYQTGEYRHWRHDPQDSSSISNNSINIIRESIYKGRKVYWIGTKDGLNRFDPDSEKFYRYTVNDGLPSAVIQGILEDEVGNLWLSTNNGLSRFNPQTGNFKNYDSDDGLLSNQFYWAACLKTSDGALFFGGTNGLNYFYPDQLKDNNHFPEIVLTGFNIFNKPVLLNRNNETEKGDVILNKHISFTREIFLTYRENIFSFEFAALDFRSPLKNKYAYKMEDVDPDWVYVDASRRFATYTNLDPGEYIFKVIGSNNDGVWNENGASVKIFITPPWWKSQLAYILYFIFFIAVAITTWRMQLRRIHLRQQMQMKHFEAEKLREVDHLKSRFFANISHEFRTPLTLIKGPVTQMLEGKFAGNIKEQYSMILRNSNRLLSLINQILDLSKLESGEMKLKVTETDVVKYLKGITLSFSSFAESKKITLKFNSMQNSQIAFVDRDKLEKIVSNLLSNAFKFTPEEGKIEVNLKISTSPNQFPHKSQISNSQFQNSNFNFIEISIFNTGPGIPTNQLDKIFDRFYQADNHYQKDGEGSGIGLALTKDLVEVCHGEISVSSIPGKKTSFTVTLPISKEYFKDDEIIEKMETGDRKPVTEESEDFISKTSASDLPSSASEILSPASSLRYPLLLIVEDNPDVTTYISGFMESDFRILTAENGEEGLKKVLNKYPDLVISDVMMPEMDGFELCKKIKSDERVSHIPVILLTAKADLDSKIEGLEFGADDYITKPFEAHEIQIRVRNLIRQRQKLREKFSVLIDLNPADISASSMDEQLLKRLLAVFEKHIEEPDFSIEQLAREIGMSRIHLNRKIHSLTNLSTTDFIRTLRLQRAAGLLSKASGTVSEIAYKVGFNNLSYFTRAFRKHFGKLPSEFNPSK